MLPGTASPQRRRRRGRRPSRHGSTYSKYRRHQVRIGLGLGVMISQRSEWHWNNTGRNQLYSGLREKAVEQPEMAEKAVEQPEMAERKP